MVTIKYKNGTTETFEEITHCDVVGSDFLMYDKMGHLSLIANVRDIQTATVHNREEN